MNQSDAQDAPGSWPPAQLIENIEQLKKAIALWETAPVIGMDCESNSFFAYRERLCLLQVTALDQDWIVDPIALGDDLRAINPLLNDADITKVFHSAEYDMMLLRLDLDAHVQGLFDTQVAMTLLQYERTGLAHLLAENYGLEVSKKEQRSDWGKRPLTDSQIEYARTDTHYLPDLYTRLRAELIERDLLVAAEGEFERLQTEVLPPREPNFDGWQKMKKAKGLPGDAMARLRELFRWREETAGKVDKPVFRVLSNEALIDLAKSPPRDMRGLATRKGIGWPKAKRVGDEIMAALARAEGQTVEVRTKRVDPEERQRRKVRRENYEALRNWRKLQAQELGLPSERLLHRKHLEEISKRLPRTREELLQTVALNDWQRETLENSLLDVLESLPSPE